MSNGTLREDILNPCIECDKVCKEHMYVAEAIKTLLPAVQGINKKLNILTGVIIGVAMISSKESLRDLLSLFL